MSDSPSSPSLDVIIVNWNTGPELRACLRSISDANRDGYRLDRVVVVDNASTDRSWAELDDLELPLHLIRNQTNRGFAAACNQGAKGTSADYLLFLNPDTMVSPEALSRPVAFMQQAHNAASGICGVRLLDESGRTTTSCARFPTPGTFFAQALGLNQLWPSVFKPQLMLPEELERTTNVDQIIGAFFLVRRALFDAMGGFDERFFIYFEEVDFSLRARQRGVQSVLLADVTAYHRGGLSSEQIRGQRLFCSLRSRLLYALKHYSAVEAALLFGVTLGLEPISRIVRAAVRRSGTQMGETFDAYFRLLFFLGKRAWAHVTGSGRWQGAERGTRR